MHLGWGRAVLLQLAHPLVAAGVAEHSAVRTRPEAWWRRWLRTLDALCALTAGTEAEAARVAGAIDAIHARVHGRLREPMGVFPAGTAYSARDPALLRWVFATTVDSFRCAYERFVGPLGPATRDRYLAEMARAGALLGVPADDLPAGWGELEAYLAAMLASEEIAVTPVARAVARELVAAPVPVAAVPAREFVWLVAVGLLPSGIREAYGFSWGPGHEAALVGAATLARGLELALPSLPTTLRCARWVEATWPPARRRRGGNGSRRR